jgi:signal peptidase II
MSAPHNSDLRGPDPATAAPRSGDATLRIRYFAISLVLFVADQLTKGWIQRFPRGRSIQVIPGLFKITHFENSGAAFGLFQDSSSPWKFGLVLVSILALAIVLVLLWRTGRSSMTALGLSLVLGGAAGNLFDRLIHGSVVDFLLFYIGSHEWPAFNVADSAIVVGAGLLVWQILKGEGQEPMARPASVALESRDSGLS